MDSGLALVLVPHLDPKHESLMVDLLARQTRLPVKEVEDGMRVQANSVYIIPPNRYLTLEDDVLHFPEPESPRRYETAIDIFLRSLASDQREKAVGIILSGTGSHGTSGLKEIKLAGGMVIAQDPKSAEYDQMPRSAIATDLVDFVLSPGEMPDTLRRYVRHPYVNGKLRPEAAAADRIPKDLPPILAFLRTRSKFDFRFYRKSMLLRRVQRRMGLRQVNEMPDYLTLLREDPEEVSALHRDLLIGVTGFFREPEAFRVLEERVVPELVERSDIEQPIRVWVAGCATGEEAYSIAILLMEGFSESRKADSVQIFASDIDERALEVARAGVYPESISTDVMPERLRRFFIKADESHYQVNQSLRESVVFAAQNLISDAPFSKLDLISCRNLLIYLEPEMQHKVVSLFHFALNEDGYLLLGSSETIGRHSDLFEPISKKWRLYRRIGPIRRELVEIPIAASEDRRLARPVKETGARLSPAVNELMRKLLIEHYAPAAALINQNYEVLCFEGPVVDYLEFPAGEPTRDLIAMARQGLRTKIRAVVHRANREGSLATDETARVLRNGTYIPCTVTVMPLEDPTEAKGMLLVTFADRSEVGETSAESVPAEDEDSMVRQLENELEATRADLQSTIEELESSNEELKASNEEVMSMNEELQSTNEELETSKEELQSMNEELATVNNQLRDKVDELDRANNDINNLLNSTDIAAVFLDTELKIRRFTPAIGKLLNLLASDIGRPFQDFSLRFTDERLLEDAAEVINDLTPIEKEVRSEDGRWYLRRILPYRTQGHRIGGVVVTFVDITARKSVEFEQTHRLGEVEQRFRILAENVPALFSYIDAKERYLFVNKSYEEVFGCPSDEIVGRTIHELLGDDNYERVRPHVESVVAGHEEKYETEVQLRGATRWMHVHYVPNRDEEGRVNGFYALVAELTREKQALHSLEESRERLASIVDTAAEAIVTIDRSGTIDGFNPAAERIFGYEAHEALGKNVSMLMPEPYRSEHDGYIQRYLETREARIIGTGREVIGQRKDGSTFPVDLAVSEIPHQRRFTGIIRDITERKRDEEALRLNREELRMLSARLLTAEESERRRISRELHDDLNQSLAMLAVDLETLHTKSADPVAEKLEALRDRVTKLSEDVHSMAYRLHPSMLDDLGLPAAVRALADDFRKRHDIEITIHERSFPQRISVNVASCLYRVTQESLANIAKHSESPRVEIRLLGTVRGLRLSIRDFGVGFDVQSARNHRRSLGILSMEERVRLVGGKLTIWSFPRKGTWIRATVPLGATGEFTVPS